MVSFSCEACGDVLTKKKLDPHRNRCGGATFTCIDCMVHFPGVQYRSHTSCMTEGQKYQGALYKEKPIKKQNQNQYQNQNQNQYHDQSNNNYQNNNNNNWNRNNNYQNRQDTGNYDNNDAMVQHAYVEDYYEDRACDYFEYVGQTDDEKSPAEPPPEAPTPPPAAADHNVNVFDFMVAAQTPNVSKVNFDQDAKDMEIGDSTSLVRYEPKEEEFIDPYVEEAANYVEYGTGPVPTGPVPPAEFVTPVQKQDRRRERDTDEKKDRKRKHLHVHVPKDQVMTDAPPVLHSGLTGGLNRMMRPIFPPSPGDSGNDFPEPSPASPLKKTRRSKHSKQHSQSSNIIFGILSAAPKTKVKSKSKSKKSKSSSKKSSSHHHKDEKSPKLLEYRPNSRDGKVGAGNHEMVLFKPYSDSFLGLVNKGPESERGCSMNKALKRFHRERQDLGSELSKTAEEKELWKSLRLRRNERGEIVLFTLDE